jgi:hypothetical protein
MMVPRGGLRKVSRFNNLDESGTVNLSPIMLSGRECPAGCLLPDTPIDVQLNDQSTLTRLESVFWKERNVREKLLESRFPHHGGI